MVVLLLQIVTYNAKFIKVLVSSKILGSINISSFCFVLNVATPLLEECENDTHIPKMGTWESFGTPKTSELDFRGQNTSLEAFFMSLERY
jgi:hypothetical protein